MENNPIHVLLIEDNPGDTRLIWETLQEESQKRIHLEYIDRLSTGIARLAKGGIDVVILDLMLPDSWGIETFLKVHEIAPDVPIVILTSLNDEVIAFQAMQKGAQDYLVKGIMDIHQLERILRYSIVRKKAEALLKESNRQMEETLSEWKESREKAFNQERLEVLGEMASRIAKSFMDSLSPILSYSETLLTHPGKLEDKNELKRYILMMNSAAKDAVQVVSSLCKFSREREEKPFETIQLNGLIEKVITITQSKWKDEALVEGKRISIKTNLVELPPISGRASELEEVLIHLVLNSVESISENGTITISTSSKEKEVLLEVRDTGRGMSDEEKRNCMDPTFRSQEKTGLGWATVYTILHRHKGKFEIESELGKGTTIRILFPAIEKKSEGKGEEHLIEEKGSITKMRGLQSFIL